MVPNFFQPGSTDILASIRQSVLNNECQEPSRAQQEEDATELPLVTPPKKAVIATAASLIDICSKYMSTSDIEHVKEAYRYADDAHLGQVRKSGEPYITHPIAVASILAEWHLDCAAVQAGLMHDVLEDTGHTKTELAKRFGTVTAEIVDGVSKLDKLKFSSNEIAQAESFKKMLLAMSKDVRVILVKLADRLHNLRTLGVMRPEKCRRIAKETLDIYVPMAHHLGINPAFREMQELCLQHYYPRRYAVLYKELVAARKNRRPALEEILNDTKQMLERANIKGRVLGREKTCYGIYTQMRIKKLSFSEVFDIYGFRVIVTTREDCYRTLGALHMMYKPVQSRFKDFIAIPKSNGYQGLHTTVIGPAGTPVEFQIRTEKMNDIAEQGILTHWLNRGNESDIQTLTHAWLQSLLDLQQRSSNSSEFYENIKADLFPDRIYVFTPKGKIVSLPQDCTPVDFAYQIHTDVGNHVKLCRINGQQRDINTILQNGDLVEIVTSNLSHPDPRWLSFVRSGKARAEVRQYLRSLDFDSSVSIGRKILEEECAKALVEWDNIPDKIWEVLMKEHEVSSRASLYAMVGSGKASFVVIVHRLQALMQEDADKASAAKADDEITVTVNGTLQRAQIARCCHPVWGDDICAFERAGHGLTVHRASCMHAQEGRCNNAERWEDAQWGENAFQHFIVPVDVKIEDVRTGIALVAQAVSREGASIVGVNIPDDLNDPELQLMLQVANRIQLMRVMRSIRQMNGIKDVRRKFESTF